ncbi:mechanosensitive ion channel family protein [Lewinella cohaerens]|uniref:mechanosensitive ion channel family protein n=1 Tax=Lewinella cohaerens TaxID=70995 RepID=UPI00036D79B6|nr:mechanosensitive ion channel domain-containing protein [Lewinella cohaerens]
MDFFDLEKLSELVTAYGTKVIGAVLTLIIGFWIVGRITSAMDKGMMKKGIDETIRPFLSSLVSVGLKVMLLLAAASMFGIETTSFIAIFSALAFAVGLALQGSLGHFASGVLLLTFRPYKVGDLVTIGGGETGTVKGIQIFNTVLVTLDNKHIIVPNGVVTSNVITNISGQGIIGVELTFGIGYGDSIDKAREIILAVGKECPWILDDPAQGVVVGELAGSSVNLNTRPFCNSEHYWDTFFYMQEHVKKGFDAGGVSIPFPQMDVHMDK